MRIRCGRECVAPVAVCASLGRVVAVRVFPEIVDGKNQAERSRDCEHGERWKSKTARQIAVGRDRRAGKKPVGANVSELRQSARLKLMNGSMSCGPLAFVQKQVRISRRISIKPTLTLTLSRPTGEGTARTVARRFQSAWTSRPAEHDSPSPIRWERAGVRVSVSRNPKLFLHVSLR